MKTAGIVCEYNPFHNGHAHQFSMLRNAGYDCIVCLMSGNFTERGEPALFHRYLRAECALSAGADLVLELPYPYSAASAEYFADASIRIFTQIGIDSLSFGCECGNATLLTKAAEVTTSEPFLSMLQAAHVTSPDIGSAVQYAEVFRQVTGTDYPVSPNDLLGISYLRAMRKYNAPFGVFVIPRDGAAFADPELHDNVMPSSTALRTVILQGKTDSLECYMPQRCAEIVTRAIRDGSGPVDPVSFGELLFPTFRLDTPARLSGYAELSGGLADRLCRCAGQNMCYRDLLRSAATKKYTNTHIKRALLFGATDITRSDLLSSPAFTMLLAANITGCKLLAQLRKTAPGFVVTKPSDVPLSEKAREQSEQNRRADALYTLAMTQKQPADFFTRFSPIIVRNHS